MAKKRERLEIIRDILSSIKEKRQIKPTRLLYSSNLSPQMFKKYVNELLDKSLIRKEEIGKKKYYLLTGKGLEFLEQYKTIVNFIDNFGI